MKNAEEGQYAMFVE